MKIEPLGPADTNDVKKLFQKGLGADAFLYPLKNARNFFVAKDKDKGVIVGAGGLFVNSLHAKLPKVAIVVSPEYRRKRYGTKIHQAILNSNPRIPLGIDAGCMATDSIAQSFISTLGYQGYLDCFIPTIDTSENFRNPPDSLTSAEFQLLNFRQIAKGPQAARNFNLDSALRFLVLKYCQSHQWNPVTIPQDSPAWEEIVLSNVDDDFSIVAFKGDSIVGASTASIEADCLQIRWAFASADSLSEEVNILKLLIGQQLATAKINNILEASFECDSTDLALSQIPFELRILRSETWRRFRLKP